MTASDRLAALADRYWGAWLEAHPTYATTIGDRRFDDRLDPIGPAARAAQASQLRAMRDELAELVLELDSERDRTTAAALDATSSADPDFLAADFHAMTVDPLDGPQVAFLNLPILQGAATPTERAAMLARWRAMPGWLDTLADEHRRGIDEGRPPVRALVDKTIDELHELLAQPASDWPITAPARETDDPAFASELEAVVEDEIRPAFARYRAMIADDLREVARDDDHAGLMHVAGGLETYRALARAHTTVELSPDELHAIGLREIERIDREFVELGERLLDARGLDAVLERLRGDPALRFSSREEVFETARRSLDRANAAIPEWFGRLPEAPCEVVRMQPHEEKHSTIAYYREPATDGSRPGQYYINTSEPQTRPRYEAEALAFHESVPGHHLQLAIAQELDHLPAFRRFWGSTSYVEGWGLYTERLSEEMGLYSGDLDRFGILSFDAWRASRLVVDTGLHALGWSRAHAIEFMTAHTALASNNIVNEVDRYITWPGQALAYKVGQLEIRRLREETEARLGSSWDARRFHDVVLGEGAVPLRVLREVVERGLPAPA